MRKEDFSSTRGSFLERNYGEPGIYVGSVDSVRSGWRLGFFVKKEEWIIALAAILFFGLCAVGIGYMMKLKNT